MAAEAGASTANELLGTFLSLMPDAALVVDGAGRIVSINAQAAELFGYGATELDGQSVEVLVPERFRHRHRAHRAGYAEHPTVRTMGAGQDLVGRCRDGSEFAIDISLAPIGVTDEPLVVAAVRDATERRAITAAQAELAAIVQSSQDGILAMTTTGVVTSWNSGAARLLGHTADDVIGEHVSRLVPPAARAGVERLLDAALSVQHQRVLDTEWRTADGRQLPVAISVSPLRDPIGTILGFSVLLRDITERKEAEAEQRRLLAEVQRRERWQAASSEVRMTVLSGGPLTRTLQLICGESLRIVGGRAAAVVRLDDGEVAASAGDGFPPTGYHLHPLPAALDATRSLHAARFARAGEGALGPTVPGLVDLDVVLAPVSLAPGAPAVLIVAGTDPAISPTEQVSMVESLAHQATLAFEVSHARQTHQRLLLTEDRERIARDLHDVVIQRLFASGMTLQAALPLLQDERAAAKVSDVVDGLDTVIKEIRTAIFSLGARQADGAVRADLLAVAADAAAQLGFTPHVRFDGPVDTLIPVDVAAHLLAVTREALSNAARHAHAAHVDVELTVRDDAVLVISDDGVGMGEPEHRSGLANMARRANELDGTLHVDSQPGVGTRLEWRVPLRR